MAQVIRKHDAFFHRSLALGETNIFTVTFTADL